MSPREWLRKLFIAGLAVSVLVMLSGALYVAVTPPPETTEPFTEFYITDPNGTASEYPTNLSVSESKAVSVGVINHERTQTTYSIVVVGDQTLTSRTVTVDADETWEDSVDIHSDTVGMTEIRFLLYKNPTDDVEGEPYRDLRLWVNVSQSE